jgi:FtsP/CotA-like multicopper oxidase with cupredoxin domain
LVVLPNSQLPAGNLTSFKTWNQVSPLGVGPFPSAGNIFHAYVLHPTGTPNQYTVVYDSGVKTVPVPANPAGEVATFPVSPAVAVSAGDVIGFYGQGIPWDYVASSPDTVSFPASVTPALNDTMTLGVDPGFPIYPQDRTYSFGATVAPGAVTAEATATVDPKTGGITGITVTNPGSGYTSAPAVTVTSPGVTPTTPAAATAVISTGVVSSITVDESGFGFKAPNVTITGGGTPTTPAEATASGGVDDATLTEGGAGYATQPIVEFGLPDAPYCTVAPPAVSPCERATGSATKDAGGHIDAVTVDTFGSGYTQAPTVTVWDGDTTHPAPTPATVTSTVNVGRIDMTNGGAGYDSTPTVTIQDSVAPFDKGASATATVATKGAVTAVNVDTAGAGYLTPGLKKFTDTLAGLGSSAANSLNQYIPVAVPDTTTYPGTDYYEIGLVQYRQRFSSQLPTAGTLQRGYVQLSTAVVPGAHVQLTNANLDPAAAPTTLTGRFGVDSPHSLGPTIVANKNKPVRILFRNLLPSGDAGDLFLPTDTTLMGSGMGPNAVTLNAAKVPVDPPGMNMGTVTDGVRNPECGQTPKPVNCYTENRATLHLHGGITPWISDGTPHQWITPAGQTTDYPKGVSVSNVPDMPDPGDGAQTFFYTNQQSARLMFYHDHSWGITRLNVYAGEAAPFLLTDPTEQALTADTGALAGLGTGAPLIVQDKTFLPSTAKVAQTDPTWNYAKWGGEGSLWLPHVYMPAQNPGSASGMSSFGRWMYGPWFWPPAKNVKYPPIANPYYDAACDPDVEPFCEPALIPSTPNVSVGMEAFHDTPIVNGTAYPKTTVDPKAYRYRVLNAANDRSWNLSWYVADPSTGTLSEVALKPDEVAAAQTNPNISPDPDTLKSPKGPNWIQIGSEGGFLPSPVVVPPQPTTYITDPTRFDVGNVDKHSLLLAPAERADVVVDFSQYRGKTLILYNDAPAAFPARVPGYDYYTGGPNLSPVGAPTTLPGYGPNTRTVMQVKVSMAAPQPPFDRPNRTDDRMGTLVTAFAHHSNGSGVFESSQDPIIVGQAAYNTAYGSNFASVGYCNSVTLPAAKCDGFARISEQGGDTFKFDTLGAAKNGAGGQIGVTIQPKGLHDEMNSANFDEWGRMTANLGLEAPGATPLLQNIILYPFVNPATENLDVTAANAPGSPSSLDVTPISSSPDGTQIWKITHNGVDTHPLHFHLYNVQLLNRVTWDNIIIPPEPSELGWKETVRTSPLEDTIVAVRPIKPTLPFGVPDSSRAYNPSMPLGAKGSQNGANGTEAGFNNTNTVGNPIAPIVNAVASFGWEYVWHCHMLSHEEMDMMRPITVATNRALPATPNPVTASSSYVLSWTDGTPVNYSDPTSWSTGSNPGTSEIGYRIERAPYPGSAYIPVGTALANATTFTDATAVAGTRYNYRVVVYNAAGSRTSTPVVAPPITAPGVPTIGVATPANSSAVVRWTAPADGGSPITGYTVEAVAVSTGLPVATRPAAAGATSLTFPSLNNAVAYQFRVLATNAIGSSAYSALSNAVTPTTTSAVTRLSDFNRDGFTDMVARDAAGVLWLYRGDGAGAFLTKVQMGVGWNAISQIFTPGDVTGDGNADLMGIDTAGVLWLYPGNGASALSARVQKGTGWGTYTVTNAADLNGGGRPDILARDSAGVLWLYPVTGNAVIGTRSQVATGWTGMTSILGPGDVNNDGFADIMARDAAGVLWVYPGNGAGGVGTRVQVGTGWQTMTALVTPGNWDRAAGNDLISRDAAGVLSLNAGYKASNFGPALQIGVGWGAMTYLG